MAVGGVNKRRQESKKHDLVCIDRNIALKSTHTHMSAHMLLERAVKNCEGFDILPYLQTDKLTCYSFIYASRLLEQRRRILLFMAQHEA